ncbi:hypothetical protein BH11PLA1_BH11PLA1_20560 [soil metagenome]
MGFSSNEIRPDGSSVRRGATVDSGAAENGVKRDARKRPSHWRTFLERESYVQDAGYRWVRVQRRVGVLAAVRADSVLRRDMAAVVFYPEWRCSRMRRWGARILMVPMLLWGLGVPIFIMYWATGAWRWMIPIYWLQAAIPLSAVPRLFGIGWMELPIGAAGHGPESAVRRWLSVLRCPSCLHPLLPPEDSRAACVCSECGSAWIPDVVTRSG